MFFPHITLISVCFGSATTWSIRLFYRKIYKPTWWVAKVILWPKQACFFPTSYETSLSWEIIRYQRVNYPSIFTPIFSFPKSLLTASCQPCFFSQKAGLTYFFQLVKNRNYSVFFIVSKALKIYFSLRRWNTWLGPVHTVDIRTLWNGNDAADAAAPEATDAAQSAFAPDLRNKCFALLLSYRHYGDYHSRKGGLNGE